jgi:hypothetical protein
VGPDANDPDGYEDGKIDITIGSAGGPIVATPFPVRCMKYITP